MLSGRNVGLAINISRQIVHGTAAPGAQKEGCERIEKPEAVPQLFDLAGAWRASNHDTIGP